MWPGAAVVFLALLLAPIAHAKESITIGSVTAQAGDREVVVPISATTGQPLTLLSAEVTFDVALCGRIDGEMLRTAGRSLVEPQEAETQCPEAGRIKLVLLELTGESVLPAGDGVIAEWVFDVRSDAVDGIFPLTLTVNQANNGPIRAPLTAFGGWLTIDGMAPRSCISDCDGSGRVTVNELVRGVNMALDGCP